MYWVWAVLGGRCTGCVLCCEVGVLGVGCAVLGGRCTGC